MPDSDDSRGLYRVPDNGGEPTRVTELDRSRDESGARPSDVPARWSQVPVPRAAATTARRVRSDLASLDSQTRTRLLDVHSQPDYATGFLLYQRGGAVMAHPFDEKQGRLTGDAVAIAEGVDSDNDQWARDVFGVGKRSADLPVRDRRPVDLVA